MGLSVASGDQQRIRAMLCEFDDAVEEFEHGVEMLDTMLDDCNDIGLISVESGAIILSLKISSEILIVRSISRDRGIQIGSDLIDMITLVAASRKICD